MNLFAKWVIGLLIVGLAVTLMVRSFMGSVTPSLPEGPQTVQGMLSSVPLSLSRRGTHLLTANGVRLYYVESSKANLRQYEGLDVRVQGHIEPNTDPAALPVLVASGVSLIDFAMKMHSIPGVELALSAPEDWESTLFPDGARFMRKGESTVLLTVTQSSEATLPDGERVQLSGNNTVWQRLATKTTVYVQHAEGIVVFSVLDTQAVPEETFLRILHSIQFGGAASSSAPFSSVPASAASSAPLGAPCGGPAGVLCPSGQYCEVTEADGVGRCRPLKRSL